MKPIRIKPELLSLLITMGSDTFTASELTKAYLRIPQCDSLSPRAVNQYIRRNISRLKKKGMVTISSKSGYQLTDEFKEDNYLVSNAHCSKKIYPSVKNHSPVGELKNKLNHYKAELLTTMGEIEEYDAIRQQIPLERALIQGLYNEARDNCSKTLGKIRAIELLISRV